MPDMMSVDACRSSQQACSREVRAEIERVRAMVQTMAEERSGNRVRYDQMLTDIAEIKASVIQIQKESHKIFAIKMVEKIVFGLVSLVLVAVITALVRLVVVTK